MEETLADLPVEGTLPAHLDGRYLRNGPNPVGPVDPTTYHWFTGTGMVHGLRLRSGRVEWYRNRWVRSADVADALGEARRPGPVHAGMDFAANTNVIGHAGRTFAIVEGGGRPYELTDQLDTVGPCDFDGTLPGGYTAHPHRDPATGELHALSYYWGWGDRVQYSVLDVDGHVRTGLDDGPRGSARHHRHLRGFGLRAGAQLVARKGGAVGDDQTLDPVRGGECELHGDHAADRETDEMDPVDGEHENGTGAGASSNAAATRLPAAIECAIGFSIIVCTPAAASARPTSSW